MITEVQNTMTLTGNRALVTEQATQNESDPALAVRWPGIPVPLHCLPVTDATVLELYEYVFAPWVKMLGLREFKVCPGIVSATLPQNDRCATRQKPRSHASEEMLMMPPCVSGWNQFPSRLATH